MRGARHPYMIGMAIVAVAITTAAILPVTPAYASGSISPGSWDFGQVDVGSSSGGKTFTVSNTDSVNTVVVNSVSASGDFGVPNNNCNGNTLSIAGDPGDSCTVDVTFSPSSGGNLSGTLTADLSDSTSAQASLSGTGHQPAPAVNLGSGIAFGGVPVGTTSGSQSTTLNNSGDATLTYSISTNSAFNLAGGSCGASGSLGGASSCSILVSFSPTQAISYNGSITVTSNAASSPDNASLSGTGTAPAISTSPGSLAFGNQGLNTSSVTKSITVHNTGGAPLSITGINTTGDFHHTENCPASLGAGLSCTVSVYFRPTGLGARSSHTTIVSNAGTKSIALSGTGVAPSVSLSPGTVNFGDVRVDTTSAAHVVTMKNIGTQTLTGISITASPQFGATGCPSSLGVGQTCAISLTLHPNSLGVKNGQLIVSDSAGTQAVALTGRGVAPGVKLKPTSLTFGKQAVGHDSAPKTITLTNTGTAALNVTDVLDFGNFSETDTCAGNQVPPGGTCVISVVFSPTDFGDRKGAIAVDDDAGRQTVALEGTGVTASSAGLAGGPDTPPYSPIPQSGLPGAAHNSPEGAGSSGGRRTSFSIPIVAGSLLVLVLLVGLILFFLRRGRRERPLPVWPGGEIPLLGSLGSIGEDGDGFADEPRAPAVGFELERLGESVLVPAAEPVGVSHTWRAPDARPPAGVSLDAFFGPEPARSGPSAAPAAPAPQSAWGTPIRGPEPIPEPEPVPDPEPAPQPQPLPEPEPAPGPLPQPQPMPQPFPPLDGHRTRGRRGRQEPTPEPASSPPLLGLIEKEMNDLTQVTDQLVEDTPAQPDPS